MSSVKYRPIYNKEDKIMLRDKYVHAFLTLVLYGKTYHRRLLLGDEQYAYAYIDGIHLFYADCGKDMLITVNNITEEIANNILGRFPTAMHTFDDGTSIHCLRLSTIDGLKTESFYNKAEIFKTELDEKVVAVLASYSTEEYDDKNIAYGVTMLEADAPLGVMDVPKGIYDYIKGAKVTSELVLIKMWENVKNRNVMLEMFKQLSDC